MERQSSIDRATALAERFADLTPRYTSHEATLEATRCLFCFDAPCTRACPARIDVAKFIRQIMHDDVLGAAETILNANIFGGSCARACPTEVLCEGACVENTRLAAPVRIGALQRYACDSAATMGVSFFNAGAPTGRKVAIIGAGPAGLTCAHELRKRGHAATVFDARERPGGINTYGIARYKYGEGFPASEVSRVLEIGGIDPRLSSSVGAAEIGKLLSSHDAVFLAVGLGRTASLGIEGEDLAGVWEALDFLFQPHTKRLEDCTCGEQVVVIGGGNTAVDAATTAARLGAQKVTIAYRRTEADMPAFKYEYELTKHDGVSWEFCAAPARILGDGGRVVGVEFTRTRAGEEGRSAKLENVPHSQFTIAADMVIEALGQVPLHDLLGAIPGLQLDGGKVLVDPTTGATSVPKLFAGGDCTTRGAEVVDAVAQGKTAAAGIHALLTTDKAAKR